MLIGANVPETLIPTDVRRRLESQPSAVKTVFGWTLFGVRKNVRINAQIALLQASTNRDFHSSVEQFWVPGEHAEEVRSVHVNLLRTNRDVTLHQQVERFFVQEMLRFIWSAIRPCHRRTGTYFTSLRLRPNLWMVVILSRCCVWNHPSHFQTVVRGHLDAFGLSCNACERTRNYGTSN